MPACGTQCLLLHDSFFFDTLAKYRKDKGTHLLNFNTRCKLCILVRQLQIGVATSCDCWVGNRLGCDTYIRALGTSTMSLLSSRGRRPYTSNVICLTQNSNDSKVRTSKFGQELLTRDHKPSGPNPFDVALRDFTPNVPINNCRSTASVHSGKAVALPPSKQF